MYRFYFSWFRTCLTFAGFVFLLSLGFWQLHRADEKKHILDTVDAYARMQPKRWPAEAAQPHAFQRIVLKGVYGQKIIFLDNQFYRHQFGYHVLQPLQIDSGQWVLVDRGWIPVKTRQGAFPKIPIPVGRQDLSGYVYYPSAKGLSLGAQLDSQQGNQFLIEKLEISFIEKLLQHRLKPFIIRLEKSDESAFVRDWPVVSMPPARHKAYALQWFLMALALVVIYCVLSFRNCKS